MTDDRLRELGDALEHAVARRIDAERNTSGSARHLIDVNRTEEHSMSQPSTPTTRRRRFVVPIAIGVVLVAGGAVAAKAILSTDTVEHGMPGGSVMFTDTSPSCQTQDDVVFTCTLQHAPTEEVQDSYLGTLEPIVDEASVVNGGCRGEDAAGLHWTCYLGERAVTEGIIGPDFLGQPTTGPGRG